MQKKLQRRSCFLKDALLDNTQIEKPKIHPLNCYKGTSLQRAQVTISGVCAPRIWMKRILNKICFIQMRGAHLEKFKVSK